VQRVQVLHRCVAKLRDARPHALQQRHRLHARNTPTRSKPAQNTTASRRRHVERGKWNNETIDERGGCAGGGVGVGVGAGASAAIARHLPHCSASHDRCTGYR
jgi:hypothetical protein